MPSRQPPKPPTPHKAAVSEPVALYDAKTHLSSLVDRAAAGEQFVITKSGKPTARLIPLEPVRAERKPGQGKGKWQLAHDFDAALPDDIFDAFDGQ